MAVNLSFIGGAGWQFLDDNGNPLSGGKIFTYAAGTTTPLATYTSRDGTTANANPIILDAAGRTPQQIWSTEGLLYKYAVTTSTNTSVRVWDNIGGSVVASDLAQTLAAPNGASAVGFTGFKNQVGTVASLATGDGADWVGFTAAGTGATPRSVRDKSRDIISVKDFGAVANGTTDDSAAFIAAREAALAAGTREVYIPAGRYYLTQENVMGARSTAASGVTQGFTWRGAGMRVTEITYGNPSAYMIYNDNDQQFINYVGISFDGNITAQTSRFMFQTSANQAQSIRFWDCRWRYWLNISVIQGTANASEMMYVGCKIQTCYGKAFTCDNAQSVNHSYYSCDFEVMYDDIWYFTKGGVLNVYGGSMIMSAVPSGINTGAVLHINDLSGAGIGFNNWTFTFYGIRTELFQESLVLRGNAFGNVTFYGCNLEQISNDLTRTVFYVSDGLYVTADGCALDGKVYVDADSSTWSLSTRPGVFTASGCTLGSNFTWERAGVSSQPAGQGKIIIDKCKSIKLPSGQAAPLDQMVGWRDGNSTFAIPRRIAIIRNPVRVGGLPQQTTDLVCTLPLDAVITSVRLYHPAETGPAGQQYFLYNNDKTVTIANWTINIGTTYNAPTALYRECSTDNERTLRFTGAAANTAASFTGYLEVEYIA